jgi:hypothetical protein
MRHFLSWTIPVALLTLICFSAPKSWGGDKIIRPEEIKSKRQVIYDDATYAKLADLWKAYNEEYPSEYAYANWMYAARYAGDRNYPELLTKGVSRYQANPVLLYLKGLDQLGLSAAAEGRENLEKAVAIDPSYADPWFALALCYMRSGEEERLNLALRRLLESGIITDEVMDYNYNVLTGLDEKAILITNGDNDTYPAWILTRILNVRSDVTIVNRSLLSTVWYPTYLIDRGFPRFMDKARLADLQSSLLKDGSGALLGDTLILKIIESAELSGRPVYLARTVFVTDMLEDAYQKGRDLGLAVLASRPNVPLEKQLVQVYNRWLDSFRTDGLQSWRVRNAPLTDAGRMIVCNYAQGAVTNLKALKKCAPDLRTKLFHWYTEYVERLLSEKNRSTAAMAWCCDASDIKEIETWSKQQGLKCEEIVK